MTSFSKWDLTKEITAWKVSNYRVFSGPYFATFGLYQSGTTGSIIQKLTRIQADYAECLSRKFVFGAFYTFK